jgi:oxygen-independent coproporphyrinogen-3 oxidase
MEIQSVKPLVKEVSFKSVFVGGGTVTVLDDSKLSSLLDCIKNNFNLDIRNGEFSVELAPHGLTESKLDIIEKAGVNRITLGIQSLDSALLKNMNRPALPKEKLRSLIASISKRKFKDFNVDLMVGIEGRDITNLQEDFDTLSNWGCQSIMVYIDLTSYRNENKLQEVDYYKSMVQQLAKSVSNKFTVNFGGGINEYNRFISRDACQIRHDRSYYSTNFKDESIFCLGVGRQAQSWNKDMMFYYQ